MLRLKNKARTARGKRMLDQRAPKMVENAKKTLFLHGETSSQQMKDVLHDLYGLKRTLSTHLHKKNKIRPFEDISPLEHLCERNDTSLFAFGTHSKKRPQNLVVGRMYDNQVLDVVEFGVDAFKSVADIGSSVKPMLGSKPLMLFEGAAFDQDPTYTRIMNLLLDFFQGERIEAINLGGIDSLIVCSVDNGVVYMRHYGIVLKKSGTRLPRVELEEVGPSLDLAVRRTALADGETYKRACRYPKGAKTKKIKNQEKSGTFDTLGRVHMEKQDLNQMALRKFKATKRGAGNDEESDEEEKGPKMTKAKKRRINARAVRSQGAEDELEFESGDESDE